VGDHAGDAVDVRFDPRQLWRDHRSAPLPALRRPPFLAIVASATLAQALAREPATRPDGFVIEGATAGGHNAPPRGKLRLDDTGQPLYGPRDVVDPAAVARLGLPFWLAGGYGTPEGLTRARACGATGVQVGTLFALCAESGLAEPLKSALLAQARTGTSQVQTDPKASPTGFPFKIAALADTLSDPAVHDARARVCDLGFLSEAYRRTDDSIGYRCAAEPMADYTRKGGERSDTADRLCLCNALTATAGLPQRRAGGATEPAVVTAGDGLAEVAALLADGRRHYSAADVLHHMAASSL
jgi:NAD(P)H-dependent flavin oxidoreductase YrpB (nitropropane dioxygenase family)